MATMCTISDLKLERRADTGSFRLEFDTDIITLEATVLEKERKIPIMGQSGAGKSTLLNALASIAWPKSGSIKWQFPGLKNSYQWNGDAPLADKQAHQLRRQFFGFVFQNTSLLPYCTIGENLIYPQLLLGTNFRVAKKKACELLTKAIPDKSFKDLSNRYINQISGGERQRVALAQALVNDPYVVFADEPTGSLDRETRKTIMDMLYEWVEEHNHRLLLWVTHHEDDPENAGSDCRLLVSKSKLQNGTQYCVCKKELI